MTPEDFIAKWNPNTRSERAACQEHFIDLCHLLGEPTPNTDPTGNSYAFEKGATKATGEDGWADVWRRERFAWEYKGKRKNLDDAYKQLLLYAGNLGNPPLLVVSDIQRIVVRTAWTNVVSEQHDILLEQLTDPLKLRLLKNVFSDPDRLRPTKTREALTAEAAASFAGLAERLRQRGHAPAVVAHFVNRLVFCLFADDVGLLPSGLFEQLLGAARRAPARFVGYAQELFEAMATGGEVKYSPIQWFNGGLFDDETALPLEAGDIEALQRTASLDWAEIDPSIFGTLFERGLDPGKRSQLGAHYTDRDKIMMIVEPVIVRPLTAEWGAERDRIANLINESKSALNDALARAAGHPELEDEVREVRARYGNRVQLALFDDLAKQRRVRHLDVVRAELRAADRAHAEARAGARDSIGTFLQRIQNFRVLDPACGSGNFLYLALLALKDLEQRVNLDAEALGFQRAFPSVGPQVVLGIEINAYAAELARVSVWIGEIQWMLRNGYNVPDNPILKPLDNIECRDALLAPDGTEAEWPTADVIIGNPPFLGDKLMKGVLGQDYVDRLRRVYKNQVPGNADLVMYWFAKAYKQFGISSVSRFGLVATNSVRQSANRSIILSAGEQFAIYSAWSDEPWVNDGAAVQVSLICVKRFSSDDIGKYSLNGKAVASIYSDLTPGAIAGTVDFTKSRRLVENIGHSFFGYCLAGPFSINGDTARQWLLEPNPHGQPNSDVLRPLYNGKDLTGRPRDLWVIDFGADKAEAAAALYEKPFDHVLETVRPVREKNNRPSRVRYWWRHGETRPGLRRRLHGLARYICTVERSKHRFFVLLPASVSPDHRLVVFPFDSMVMFGILSSRFHAAWALRMGSTLEDRPGYNTRVCFDTFPFPEGMGPTALLERGNADPLARRIEDAAATFNDLRENALNPPALIRREPEVVAGFPDRLFPLDAGAAAQLKLRTMTKLYNKPPTWLANAQRGIDDAVAAAYGWDSAISDDDALSRLFALNQQRRPVPPTAARKQARSK